MSYLAFTNREIFTWVIVPLLIFISRIFDVSIGTIRIIFVSRGNKLLSPILGFFEVLIWITAISQVMKQLDNFMCYIAYAGGFSMGTFVGLYIEEKLAVGILTVRIITTGFEEKIKKGLFTAGFGFTIVDAKGANGNVKLIYTVIKRKDLQNVLEIINKYNPNAFYSIEDARSVNLGVFPRRHFKQKQSYSELFRLNRLFGSDNNSKSK